MAKIRQVWSGGGLTTFKNRPVGDDDEVTRKEQQIIDFIEKQRQQTLAVRQESYKDQKSVMDKEADHKKNTLQKLKTELWAAKYKNTDKRQQTEVAYYRGLAEEADKKADFFSQWSPKLGEAIRKGGQGAWDALSYFRDKAVDDANRKREEREKNREGEFSTDQCGRDYDDPMYGAPCDKEEPEPDIGPDDTWNPNKNVVGWQVDGVTQPGKSFISTDQLQQNADISVHALSNNAQANLHEDGEFAAADELMGQTFGRSANTKWWGTYYGRQAASTFEQDWPTIVALAEDNVDPSERGEDLIEASYYKWLEHKGIGLNSIAGKEVTKKFRSKLNALSNSRTQQTLAYRDEVKSNKLAENFKANLNAPAEVRENILSQWVLHEARKNTYINGVFSPRGSRVINYGQTFDTLVEPLLKLYEWESFDEFTDKILSLKIINKGEFIDPNRPDWLTQRSHKIQEYQDLFNKEFDKNVKRARTAAEIRAAKRKADNQANPKYDFNSTEFGGFEALWAGLEAAETPDERKWFGEKLGYNLKSRVSKAQFEPMYNAARKGDWQAYNWHRSHLKTEDLKYYDEKYSMTKEMVALEGSGWNIKLQTKTANNALKSRLSDAFSTNPNHSPQSLPEAQLYAIQRFIDINLEHKVDDYDQESDRRTAVEKQWLEEINDEKGLFTVVDGEFIHFKADYNFEDIDLSSVPALKGKEYGQITLQDLEGDPDNKEPIDPVKLLPQRMVADWKKRLIRGEKIPYIVPRSLWKFSQDNNIPLSDLMNQQLRLEELPENYGFTGWGEGTIVTTTAEMLEAKGYIPRFNDPTNVINVSAYLDANTWAKETKGINLITPEATAYLADKGIEFKPPENLEKYDSLAAMYRKQVKGDTENNATPFMTHLTPTVQKRGKGYKGQNEYLMFSLVKLEGEK